MNIQCLQSSILLLSLFTVPVALGNESDCLVDAYLRALTQTQQETAQPKDIDALLDFYADDIVYEHPRVGAVIEGKARIRQGMLAFLGKTRNPSIRVEKYLGEADVIVVEYDREFEMLSNNNWQQRIQHQVTIFEIADGKITRVRDYW